MARNGLNARELAEFRKLLQRKEDEGVSGPAAKRLKDLVIQSGLSAQEISKLYVRKDRKQAVLAPAEA